MEQLQGNSNLILFFFVLFLGTVVLVEQCKKRTKIKIGSILKKIPWDKLWTIFVVWTLILVIRKQLYYMPHTGVVQTKDSLWWVAPTVYFFVMGFIGILLMSFSVKARNKLQTLLTGKQLRDTLIYLESMLVFGFILLVHVTGNFTLFFPGENTDTVITAVLLPLKMICTGTFAGLLTGILMAYYIVDGYQRLNKIIIKPGKIKITANLFLAVGLSILFFVLQQTYFSKGWEKKFAAELHSAQTGKQGKKYENLLDGVNSIVDKKVQSHKLKEVALSILETGDWEWALGTAITINDTWIKFDAFKQFYEVTSRSGNSHGSEAVLEQMIDFVKPLDDAAKFRTLKEMMAITSKTGNINWIKKIIKQEVLAAVRIENQEHRIKALTKIAVDIAALGYINRAEEIFQQAIEQVNFLKDSKDRPRLLKEIAITIANTGDIQWATSTARLIPDEEIKNLTLTEIQGKSKKKKEND